MLNFHQDNKADATIAVIDVPLEEASRFGIMNTREDSSIYEFEEKPKNPKSTNASMGVYIFNWKILKEYLKNDEKDITSSNDFGKNIIPSMLNTGRKLVAYPFKAYWKDVGTIESLWQANMDLLNINNDLNLYDKKWKIYTQSQSSPAHYIGKNAIVKNSLVVEGCKIEGKVENSILSQGVSVGKNTVIRDSVIMPNVEIGDNVIIEKAIIGTGVIIDDNYVFINREEIGIVEANKYLGENGQIYPKEIMDGNIDNKIKGYALKG